MSTLFEIQRSFSNYLLNNSQAGDELEKFIDNKHERGLSVYKKGYVLTFLDLLRDIYPVTESMVGEANFKFFAREFIYAHPYNQRDLNGYGDRFGEFLASRDELKAPVFHEMAIWEWIWHFERVDYKHQMTAGLFDCWQSFIQGGPTGQCLPNYGAPKEEAYLSWARGKIVAYKKCNGSKQGLIK